MIILGVDPGYDRLGVAIIQKDRGGKELVLFSDCFLSDKKAAFADRIVTLGKALEETIRTHGPGYLALEKLFFTKNQRTAMGVAEMRGVVTYLAALHGLAIHEFTPGEVKVAVTGAGNADKKQVMEMVPRLVALPHTPKHDDEYDAVAIALTAAATIRV